jgi:hypothetical protein
VARARERFVESEAIANELGLRPEHERTQAGLTALGNLVSRRG